MRSKEARLGWRAHRNSYGTKFRSLGDKADRRLNQSDLRSSRFITFGIVAERPAKKPGFSFEERNGPQQGFIWPEPSFHCAKRRSRRLH
jgi:hypothetical protein